MSALERLLGATLAVVFLVVATWLGMRHYGAQQRQAGWDAAVAAGAEQREHQAALARETETTLRAQLLDNDAAALTQERKHAESLEDAQRRVRAGVDRLRCPAAGPVPGAAAASDRPAAGGPVADAPGPELVPEAAAEILGDGADVAGLVRRYQRVVDRFETCRTMYAQ